MLRIINKLDQEKMSERLNVSQPVYSRYETGEKLVQPNDDFVRRVADEFNVSAEWLISSENSNINFEAGSIASGANGTGQIENYYTVPKDFLAAFKATKDYRSNFRDACK